MFGIRSFDGYFRKRIFQDSYRIINLLFLICFLDLFILYKKLGDIYMQIANDKVVSIHYTLKDNDGKILDSSEGKDPLKYIQGKQNIIPGLENAMEGKSVGDKFNVKVEPNEGYGERNDQMVVSIPRTSFGEIKDINPGMQFQLNSQNGPVVVTVVETDDENVKVDANHPLAGVELNFDVEVMDIREATTEELDHGHVH